MAPFLLTAAKKLGSISPFPLTLRRGFRSDAALAAARCENHNLILYNYPSFSAAYAALFAHIFHSRRSIPPLSLPFSYFHPFRVEDFGVGAFNTCYLLGFVGPGSFVLDLSSSVSRVIAFDHREVTAKRVLGFGEVPGNLELKVDTSNSSAQAVYDYFFADGTINILEREEEERISTILEYIEDADLRKWKLSNSRTFQIGLIDERAKLNCITNPRVFDQLLELDASHLVAKGDSMTYSRQVAANKLTEKAFKIQLGRGIHGECLACRIDGNTDLAHEIAFELSRKSSAAGLRPIGAVIFMRQTNLKMCLRTTDHAINLSEIAKEYGGGGNSSSSSFIIRMDEYNQWISKTHFRE